MEGGRPRVWTLALFLAALCGCAPSGGQAPRRVEARLVLTGSSTAAPLAAEIAKRFEASHPGVRIDVQTGGSSRGIADTRSGAADIGMVSRALRPSEQDLIPHTIALDGIGLIVHSSNPVDRLTKPQVRDIYLGRIGNWRELGGREAEIVVVNKAEGRATLDLFLEHFELKSSEIDADVVIGDNEQGIKTVAGNPNAIGYVSIGAAEYNAQHGVTIKLVAAGDVPATRPNVQRGTYPISRPLNLVTREQPTGLARQFIEYARSKEIADLIHAQHMVPIAP